MPQKIVVAQLFALVGEFVVMTWYVCGLSLVFHWIVILGDVFLVIGSEIGGPILKSARA